MPRYYSSSDSLSDVTCSVNCCCLWMFLVVLTIVPGFLLVVIGCPCNTNSSLNLSEDLCIDCAIIGDIFLSVGGSVTVVGCLYYCCLNYCLKLSTGAAARRNKLNRVPARITVTPSENQSCQMQTMNDSRVVINIPENTVDTIPCTNNDRLKPGNYSPIQEEDILINDREHTSKGSMNEEASSMSSLFSDTVLNGVDSKSV